MQILFYPYNSRLRQCRYASTNKVMTVVSCTTMTLDAKPRYSTIRSRNHPDLNHDDYASIFSMTTFVNG